MTDSRYRKAVEKRLSFGETVFIVYWTILSVGAGEIHEPTGQKMLGLLCWVYGHDWIDEMRYGTEPRCATCGKERDAP